jgi:hypothetical protein
MKSIVSACFIFIFSTITIAQESMEKDSIIERLKTRMGVSSSFGVKIFNHDKINAVSNFYGFPSLPKGAFFFSLGATKNFKNKKSYVESNFEGFFTSTDMDENNLNPRAVDFWGINLISNANIDFIKSSNNSILGIFGLGISYMQTIHRQTNKNNLSTQLSNFNNSNNYFSTVNHNFGPLLNFGLGYQHVFNTKYSDFTLGARGNYNLYLFLDGLKELSPNNFGLNLYFKVNLNKEQRLNQLIREDQRNI